MSDPSVLAAVRETYSDLAQWQLRAQRTPPEEPERGSVLFVDDAIFRWHPISEICRVSLITAGEHLRAARDLIEADQLYPTAHFTVLRSALVGASQAVWILAAPDRAERRERGLMLIGEMYRQMMGYFRELDGSELNPQERIQLESQVEWCRTRMKQVQEVRRSTAKLIQTEVIKEALEIRFPEPGHRLHGRVLWRQMSADAHVLGWSMFQRSEVLSKAGKDGVGVMLAGGDVGDIAEPYLLSFRLLKEGWSRFDRLCEDDQRS